MQVMHRTARGCAAGRSAASLPCRASAAGHSQAASAPPQCCTLAVDRIVRAPGSPRHDLTEDGRLTELHSRGRSSQHHGECEGDQSCLIRCGGRTCDQTPNQVVADRPTAPGGIGCCCAIMGWSGEFAAHAMSPTGGPPPLAPPRRSLAARSHRPPCRVPPRLLHSGVQGDSDMEDYGFEYSGAARQRGCQPACACLRSGGGVHMPMVPAAARGLPDAPPATPCAYTCRRGAGGTGRGH